MTCKEPERTLDTMSDAIALSSPSGKMSKRARRAAEERLRESLFGDGSCFKVQPKREKETDALLRRAKELRELAARGMSKRKFIKLANTLEKQAESLMARTSK